MRRAVIWTVSVVLAFTGCAGGDAEPTANMSAIELSSLPAEELLLADQPVVEAALRSCPINCRGVCACAFLRCVQGGGDVAECTAERDACIEECGFEPDWLVTDDE